MDNKAIINEITAAYHKATYRDVAFPGVHLSIQESSNNDVKYPFLLHFIFKSGNDHNHQNKTFCFCDLEERNAFLNLMHFAYCNITFLAKCCKSKKKNNDVFYDVAL